MYIKRELSTTDIQEIIFQGLKEFRDFCIAHDLKYFIAYGTLLGAVRYKNFIPWDDDADIMMPRKDYDKLLEYSKHITTKEWELISYKTHPGYYIPWMKFSYRNSQLRPSRFNSGMLYGLAFDIFPIDYINASSEKEALSKAYELNSIYKRKSHELQPFAEVKPGLKNLVRRLYKKFYFHTLGKMKGSIVDVISNMEDELRKVQPSELNYACNVFGYLTFIYYTRDFLHRVDFEFHGEHFTGPIGYIHFLSVRYGEDYMVPPPEAERVIHHSYQLYFKED